MRRGINTYQLELQIMQFKNYAIILHKVQGYITYFNYIMFINMFGLTQQTNNIPAKSDTKWYKLSEWHCCISYRQVIGYAVKLIFIYPIVILYVNTILHRFSLLSHFAIVYIKISQIIYKNNNSEQNDFERKSH